MSGPNRAVELTAAAFLDKLQEGSGRIYRDLAGPAIYRLEPSWRTVVMCLACHFLTLIPTIPRRATVHACSRCGTRVLLIPPPAVIEVPEPVHPRLGRRRPH